MHYIFVWLFFFFDEIECIAEENERSMNTANIFDVDLAKPFRNWPILVRSMLHLKSTNKSHIDISKYQEKLLLREWRDKTLPIDTKCTIAMHEHLLLYYLPTASSLFFSFS